MEVTLAPTEWLIASLQHAVAISRLIEIRGKYVMIQAPENSFGLKVLKIILVLQVQQ